jgi:hypothetical protein
MLELSFSSNFSMICGALGMADGKYSALRDFLMLQKGREFILSFVEIEKVLGFDLPQSAERPQWWANTQSQTSHVQREAWRSAGYDAFLQANRSSVKFVKV